MTTTLTSQSPAQPLTSQRVLPQPPEARTYDVIRSEMSLDVYRAEKNWVVGLLNDIPPPDRIKDEWENEIRDDFEHSLCAAIQHLKLAEKKMITELVLCMAGKVCPPDEVIRGYGNGLPPNPVVLRPALWILCASRRCKWKIESMIDNFPDLKRFLDRYFMERPYVSRNAPWPATADQMSTAAPYIYTGRESLSFVVQTPHSGAVPGIMTKFLVETGIGGVERISTIGGLIMVNNYVYGLTTAHTIVNYFEEEHSDGEATDSADENGSTLESRSSTDSDSESSRTTSPPPKKRLRVSSAWSFETVGNEVQNSPALGSTQFNETPQNEWMKVEAPLILAYKGKGTSNGDYLFSQEAPKNSDFALIDLSSFGEISNTFLNPGGSGVGQVSEFIPNALLGEGKVWVLSAPRGYLLQGHLLEGESSVIVGGTIMRTKKIQMLSAGIPGMSGSWVIRDEKLCGIVYAAYDRSPYLHMLPAENVLKDISEFLKTSSVRVANAVAKDSATTERTSIKVLSSEVGKEVSTEPGSPPDIVFQPGHSLQEDSRGRQTTSKSSDFESLTAEVVATNLQGKSSTTDLSQSGMLPPTNSPGVDNPASPSLSAKAQDSCTTSTPHLSQHTLSPYDHLETLTSRIPYTPVPEIPRSVLTSSGALSLSPPSTRSYGNTGPNMLSYQAQHDARQQPESPPFSAQENFHQITGDGQSIVPHIDCKVEKGFFFSQDRTWTCYRRNYFSINCSYTLAPHLPNSRLYLDRGGRNGPEQIQAMAVTLSAAMDGAAGKSIELVQHTPKRDKGPQLQIQMEKLMPMPPGKGAAETHGYPLQFTHSTATLAPPFLPLQQDSEQSYSPAGHSATSHQHTFERIQFKSATANNGKRRAQQQYYHLIVELYADVRRLSNPQPDWVRVAQRVSAAVVVRSRSPSHYQHEGPYSISSSRDGSTGSGATGPGHVAYGGAGAPSGARRGIGNGLTMRSGAVIGEPVYRGIHQYQFKNSPVGSLSISSTDSASVGTVGGVVGGRTVMEEEDSQAINQIDGYEYHPSSVAEAGLAKLEYSSATETVKVETSEGTAPSSSSVGGMKRYQGVDTSRGFFPDLNGGY